MAHTNVRLFQVNTPVNVEMTSEKYLNAGVNAYAGQFESITGNSTARAGVFAPNNFLIMKKNRTIDLPGEFTIAMWIKFAPAHYTQADITVMLRFEDGSEVHTTLPRSGYDWVNTAYYLAITRDSSGNIEFKINGTTFDTKTSTADLNLTSDSFLLIDAIGYSDAVGNTAIVDDLVISDTVMTEASTTPTNYLKSYSIDPNKIPLNLLTSILKVY